MPLDPQAQQLLDEMQASGQPPLHTLPVDEARRRKEITHADQGPLAPVQSVEDVRIPGPGGEIPVRIYTPERAGPLPVLVYYHGGGWVLNSLATHDPLCRALANEAGWVVISVDYRLAPEHPYPAALEDACAAAAWAVENAPTRGWDAGRMGVGGDSSGGNLAAAVCLRARDRQAVVPFCQWLVYPALDSYDPGTESYQSLGVGFSLEREGMIWFWEAYAPGMAGAEDPYLFPLRARDKRGLPQAFVLVSEYDPLRDEGEQYATHMGAAGVAVTLRRSPGLLHGFLLQRHRLRRAQAEFLLAADWLRRVGEARR